MWTCCQPQMSGYWCFNEAAGLQLFLYFKNFVSMDTTKLGLMLQAIFLQVLSEKFTSFYEKSTSFYEK